MHILTLFGGRKNSRRQFCQLTVFGR